MIDAKDLLEALTPTQVGEAVKFNKRRTVFLITPDPFMNHNKSNEYLKYGFRACADSGRKQEAPLLCYSLKLGIYGFNQWTMRAGPFSEQELFDMQVSLMLKCNYAAVYSSGEYTESMNKLLNVARLRMNRIDIRTI